MSLLSDNAVYMVSVGWLDYKFRASKHVLFALPLKKRCTSQEKNDTTGKLESKVVVFLTLSKSKSPHFITIKHLQQNI